VRLPTPIKVGRTPTIDLTKGFTVKRDHMRRVTVAGLMVTNTPVNNVLHRDIVLDLSVQQAAELYYALGNILNGDTT
jgi:hypothetical protein